MRGDLRRPCVGLGMPRIPARRARARLPRPERRLGLVEAIGHAADRGYRTGIGMKKHSNRGLPVTPGSTELLKVILDGRGLLPVNN